jgi:hypothetical protein
VVTRVEGLQARTETFGREFLGDRTDRGIERVERRLGCICLDLMLAQAGERRLGFRERAGENRGTLDAASPCDPDRLRRAGDPPPAFELREPHLLLQDMALEFGDFSSE